MSDNMKVLNMSDPLNFKLTPGLTLGMGHPVKIRIRRLNMKATDKFTRLGLCGFTALGLGLTTPIVTQVSANEAAATATVEATGPVIAKLILSPTVMDEEIEKELNRRRKAVVDGELPATAITNWTGLNSNIVKMQLTEDGLKSAVIYDVNGEELGAAERKVMLASLEPLIDLCASHAKTQTNPDYYNMPAGSTGVIYSASCHPELKTGEDELTADEKIAIIMADEDIDLETRQARSVGIKARDLIAKFQAANPNPTWQEAYDECIYQRQQIWSIYRTDVDTPAVKQEMAEVCEGYITKSHGARPE